MRSKKPCTRGRKPKNGSSIKIRSRLSSAQQDDEDSPERDTSSQLDFEREGLVSNSEDTEIELRRYLYPEIMGDIK
jgi:hypothetical protein